ncbi:MAG TPA: hypothetical protein VET46_13930 [Steroidobacteraceae bacterium]|nr:hypothetical protein [Steroidobacteraceae bacterium]
MTMQRFEGLSRRLLRAGIAPHHVKRLVVEIEAHFADLVAELRSAGLSQAESESQAAVRLGTEEVLTANILAHPELRSWARQRPWLAFVVLPLVALAVQFVLSMLAAVGVIVFSTHVLGITSLYPGPVPWVVAGLQAYGVWIAPVAAAGAACLIAARSGAPITWPVAGCTLVALLGAATNASFEWSPAGPQGVLSGGIGLHVPELGLASSLRTILTILTVLVPVLWLRRRRKELASLP